MVPLMSSDCWNDAELVTGSLDQDRVAELERFVRAGGAVVVAAEPDDRCGEAFTGVDVIADLPHTEWFVTLADSPAAARLDGEAAVTSQLRTLRPSDAGITIAATTSVRFEHQPTIAVRTLGEGRIVVSGIADLRALVAHPTLGPFVRRLLHPALASTPTTDLGVGVVGYGPFGGMGYLRAGLAATETDGLALVAAADSAPERLVAARADFPDLAGHASAGSLAADPAVDIAIIATPPALPRRTRPGTCGRGRQTCRDREADVPAS